ncbi:hypothetical protein BKA93DRAFT_881091 [Sparassis latifolia]
MDRVRNVSDAPRCGSYAESSYDNGVERPRCGVSTPSCAHHIASTDGAHLRNQYRLCTGVIICQYQFQTRGQQDNLGSVTIPWATRRALYNRAVGKGVLGWLRFDASLSNAFFTSAGLQTDYAWKRSSCLPELRNLAIRRSPPFALPGVRSVGTAQATVFCLPPSSVWDLPQFPSLRDIRMAGCNCTPPTTMPSMQQARRHRKLTGICNRGTQEGSSHLRLASLGPSPHRRPRRPQALWLDAGDSTPPSRVELESLDSHRRAWAERRSRVEECQAQQLTALGYWTWTQGDVTKWSVLRSMELADICLADTLWIADALRLTAGGVVSANVSVRVYTASIVDVRLAKKAIAWFHDSHDSQLSVVQYCNVSRDTCAQPVCFMPAFEDPPDVLVIDSIYSPFSQSACLNPCRKCGSSMHNYHTVKEPACLLLIRQCFGNVAQNDPERSPVIFCVPSKHRMGCRGLSHQALHAGPEFWYIQVNDGTTTTSIRTVQHAVAYARIPSPGSAGLQRCAWQEMAHFTMHGPLYAFDLRKSLHLPTLFVSASLPARTIHGPSDFGYMCMPESPTKQTSVTTTPCILSSEIRTLGRLLKFKSNLQAHLILRSWQQHALPRNWLAALLSGFEERMDPLPHARSLQTSPQGA